MQPEAKERSNGCFVCRIKPIRYTPVTQHADYQENTDMRFPYAGESHIHKALICSYLGVRVHSTSRYRDKSKRFFIFVG